MKSTCLLDPTGDWDTQGEERDDAVPNLVGGGAIFACGVVGRCIIYQSTARHDIGSY